MLDRCFMRLLLVCPAVCHSYICAWEKNNKLTQHKKTSFYSNTHIFANLDFTFCFCCQFERDFHFWYQNVRCFLLTHFLFISFWPPHTKTHNTQTVLLSASECFGLYLTNSGVHTEQRCTPVSTLLSKKSGSTLRCEWRCALLSLTYILAPSLHNTQTPFLGRLFDVETPSTFPVNLRDFWA